MTQLEQLLAELPNLQDPSRIAALCQEALGLFTREQNPMLWANLQCAVAASQVEMVRGRYTPELLEQVLGAYESALTVYTMENTPAIWGQTQRNLAATHLGAVNSGLGDVVTHVEAAIAAYEQAISLPPDQHNPGIWNAAQLELADAFAIAANWRGAEAFLGSAGAYAAVLEVVSREKEPTRWAQLHLRLAASLAESGATRYEEAAIQAAEKALLILQQDTAPKAWAEAHLVRGGLYRTRSAGSRQENLANATQSLDLAATVITEADDPQGWYRLHYHRGPAYLFLRSGDRPEHLRRAVASLDIATALTPRADQPEVWASLEVSRTQALLEQDDIENGIVAGNNTLATLPPSSTSPVWLLANRLLGDAYLNRTVDDAISNRQHAIDHFVAALTLPPDAWPEPEAWFATQATLALVCFDEQGKRIGKWQLPASEEASPAQVQVNPSDPFDLAGQAAEQLGGFRPDQPTEALDEGWHVPELLNTEIGLLRRHFEGFLREGAVIPRTPEARSALERSRWSTVNLVIEHAVEKEGAARRTRALFGEIEAGRQTFALYLRGFAYRAYRYPTTTVSYAGGDLLSEIPERFRLAKALAPLPLVFISNPIDSGPMDAVNAGVVEAGSDQDVLGFRIEAGSTWESDVEQLIRAAAFIVFYNPVPTPGVAREIGVVTKLGRLNDAYFSVPDDGQKKLDDAAIAAIREAAALRAKPLDPGSLPTVTCRWMEGPSRSAGELHARAMTAWLAQRAAHPVEAAIDLDLDAHFFLLAALVLLEEMDRVPTLLRSLSALFGQIDAGSLAEGPRLAELYTQLAEAIAKR